MRIDVNPWAIVLAAGQGGGKAPLDEGAAGRVPSQFRSYGQDRSLLRATLERATAVAPRERVLVVVSKQHRRWWEPELRDHPAENVVVQPSGGGTALGVLLPAFRVFRREPRATLVVFPSDHHFDDEGPLRAALAQAIVAAWERDNRLVLLGMTADHPETGYGWIVPDRRLAGRALRVRRFAEKPSPQEARRLLLMRALWSTFIFVTRMSAFVRVYDRAAPGLVRACLAGWNGNEPSDRLVSRLDRELTAVDFSRDILQQAAGCLKVVPVEPCGWRDLGTQGGLSPRTGRVSSSHPVDLEGLV